MNLENLYEFKLIKKFCALITATLICPLWLCDFICQESLLYIYSKRKNILYKFEFLYVILQVDSLKIISQSYLIRGRKIGIIDLILILFYFYTV